MRGVKKADIFYEKKILFFFLKINFTLNLFLSSFKFTAIQFFLFFNLYTFLNFFFMKNLYTFFKSFHVSQQKLSKYIFPKNRIVFFNKISFNLKKKKKILLSNLDNFFDKNQADLSIFEQNVFFFEQNTILHFFLLRKKNNYFSFSKYAPIFFYNYFINKFFFYKNIYFKQSFFFFNNFFNVFRHLIFFFFNLDTFFLFRKLYYFFTFFFFLKKRIFFLKKKTFKEKNHLLFRYNFFFKVVNQLAQQSTTSTIRGKFTNFFFLKDFFFNFLSFFFLKKNFFKFFKLKRKHSSIFLSYLFFIPDFCFFFKNYNFILTSNFFFKYTNIIPAITISRNAFPKVKLANLSRANNILLYYLTILSENFFKKSFLFKISFINKILYNLNIRIFLKKIFNKFKRNIFRFKRNFFLSEIIKVVTLSFFLKDPALLLNCLTWTLMHIPYKDVKSFLYFLKVLIKNHVLPSTPRLNVKGFIFDIRGKVGVTGDAKKRHTLISWGQSSFSQKKLKLALKQGLVYTRTGVMGVTIIIFF